MSRIPPPALLVYQLVFTHFCGGEEQRNCAGIGLMTLFLALLVGQGVEGGGSGSTCFSHPSWDCSSLSPRKRDKSTHTQDGVANGESEEVWIWTDSSAILVMSASLSQEESFFPFREAHLRAYPLQRSLSLRRSWALGPTPVRSISVRQSSSTRP